MAIKRETIEYVIYPPGYVPFGSKRLKYAKTMCRAINIARGMGKGVCDIWRHVRRKLDKRGSTIWFTDKQYVFHNK